MFEELVVSLYLGGNNHRDPIKLQYPSQPWLTIVDQLPFPKWLTFLYCQKKVHVHSITGIASTQNGKMFCLVL